MFAMKKNYDDLFRACPYMLMLLLHKDALFHFKVNQGVDHPAGLRPQELTRGVGIGEADPDRQDDDHLTGINVIKLSFLRR
jgi:hypothetical protein